MAILVGPLLAEAEEARCKQRPYIRGEQFLLKLTDRAPRRGSADLLLNIYPRLLLLFQIRGALLLSICADWRDEST